MGQRATRGTWFKRATLSCRSKRTTKPCKDKDDKRGHSGLQSSQRGKDSQGPEGSIMLRANSGQLEKRKKLIVNELSGDEGQHSDIYIQG